MGVRKRQSSDNRKEARKSVYFAKLNDVPTSPRKMRLVADMIRGVEVHKALGMLKFSTKEAAGRLEKLLRSAIANWEQKTQARADRIRTQLLNCDESSVIVVAHRADWRNFPENSLEAIQSSIDMGVDMLEIDVQRTKDGVLMLMHDHDLNRMTNGTGNIAETTWEEISKLNLKDHQGNMTPYKVAKLEDALLLCKDRIMINLDKADRYFDEVFALLEKTGTTNLIVMKGGQPAKEVKEKFGAYLDKVIYMPVVTINNVESEQAIQAFLDDLKPVAFELCYSNTESPVPAKMKTVLKGRSLIWYNTLWDWLCGGHHDDKAVEDLEGTYGYMIDTLGARILQTDRPQLMLEYLRSRNLHE